MVNIDSRLVTVENKKIESWDVPALVKALKPIKEDDDDD